jgi:type I restriction enzyme M protein
MFENTFKNIDDILHEDAGCSSELDYVEQTSWILFLKYLDDLEQAREIGAELSNKNYEPIISGKFRWSEWATPRKTDGAIDHNKALTGDDFKAFINEELFPYLAGFKSSGTGPNTLEYKIGEIFSEIRNKVQSGYALREVVELVDKLRFQTSAEIHEMSHLYEDKIKNMGNAGRNGGEYYTPRPLIQAIINVIHPIIGEKIYDGATGSAGFLCESFIYLAESKQLTTKDVETLQRNTLFGKEKKSLPYVIGVMNMILHGIDAPNLIHTNTLSENLSDIQEKDRFDVILANPPFGGKERSEVQQNFPIKTKETAYLFLQHFMKRLKAGGRAGVVIKNTFLTNPDQGAISLRRELLSSCNLHTILVCPKGVFQGAGVETVVLFFTKGAPTQNIWLYELDPGRKLGKRNPLNIRDMQDFIAKQKDFELGDKSWFLNVSDIDSTTFMIDQKNPNKEDESIVPEPEIILEGLKDLESKRVSLLQNLAEVIK